MTLPLPLPIRTERLYLRRYLPSDGDALADCLSDPETVRFLLCPVLDAAQCRAEAAERAENPDFTAVCLPPDAEHPDGRLIGSIFLSPCAFSSYELAYLFCRAYRRRGYAQEACRAVLSAVFSLEEDGETAHRVLALCDAENAPSRRLLERLGMRCEGVMRKNLYNPDACGEKLRGDPASGWRDTCMYAILREEFFMQTPEKKPILLAELQDTEWDYTYTDHDRPIARAIVTDADGYFYFVRANRDDAFGKATLIETSGGGIEPGESPEDAIRRELREELGAEAEILGSIGIVSDYYNLIHRHNINHYFLCRAVSFGEKHLTEDEVTCFRLSTLKLTYDEAVREYEACAETRIGRLLANRELPVLRRAQQMMEG